MLRGFKLEWLDQPHRLTGMGASIVEPQRFGSPTDGTVRIKAEGSLYTGDTPDVPPHRVKIFYTLLGWDSAQVEVFSSGPTYLEERSDVPETHAIPDMPDPCPVALPPFGDVCGEVFGAAQSWDFVVLDDQVLESVDLSLVYAARMFSTGRRSGFRVNWGMSGEIVGNDERGNRWSMLARIMTGASVVVPFRDIGGSSGTIGEFPPRRDGEYQYGPNRPRGTGSWFSGEVDADMAFVQIESIWLPELDGKARHVDFELLGDFYDGHQLDCSWGIGSSRGPIGSDETFPIINLPRFGGLVRTSRSTRPHLAEQALRFERGIVGFLSLVPSQFGAVRNIGPIPVLINRVEKNGPHPADFDIRLELQGEAFSMWDVPNRAPLELRPGQTLVVGGRFFPGAEAGPNDLPRQAWIEFHTNDARESQFTVLAFGHTVRADAQGSWAPTQINFGFVSLRTGAPHTRNAVLISIGQTPLLIQSLALENDSIGFDWGILQGNPPEGDIGVGVRYQIDPGDAITIQISFMPLGVGFVETGLIAQTSMGALELRLYAEGVDG